MSEEEVINILTNFLTLEDKWRNRFNKDTVPEAIDTVLQLLEQKNNKINKVIEYCNETIEFKDAMNERYDDCYDILKILEE